MPPYADAYNLKAPGIYAAYALILGAFGQTIAAIRVGLIIVTSATTVLMYLFAARLGGPRTGLVAAAVYAVQALNPKVLGLAAYAEHFVPAKPHTRRRGRHPGGAGDRVSVGGRCARLRAALRRLAHGLRTGEEVMIGEGLHFEQHEIGATFRTLGRTVSETDIVSFVNLCGFTEPLFMDMEYVARESVFKRRAAPGALTFALSEGLIMQTGLIHGTGMAYLGGELRVTAPVLEGDTLTVEVEVADKRETKKPDRGIVTYRHRVLNQRGEMVLEARVQRMIRRAGR